MTPDDVDTKLKLWKAEDGPYKHMVRHEWKSYEGVKSICSESASEIPPIIKFRGGERGEIEKHSELGCVFNGHLN